MLLLKFLTAASVFVATGVASPVGKTHVVHEQRSASPHGWVKRDALRGSFVLPMRIALAQSNLDKAHDWLMEVSHPESNKYGQHWRADEVAKAFAPSEENIDAVRAWLATEGIPLDRVQLSQSLNWLQFDATVDEAERLLKTKYHIYEHEETGRPQAACSEYSVPASLRDKIDFVTPTLHFDAKVMPRDTAKKSPGRVGGTSQIKWNGDHVNIKELNTDLSNCDQQITPDCLRALYEFPVGTTANPDNSYGIVEYTPEAYLASDLDMFFSNFSSSQVGERPILDSIDGGFEQMEDTGFSFNGEADLDLEYAMTLVYPQKITLYQAGDDVEGASFNNFLDALDSSYCSGDDPSEDAVYPDPDCSAGTYGCYEGPETCGGFSATKVISTSYAYDEHALTPAYETRQCNEYLKLGMMGVSFLFSSGDYGVAGNGGQCIDGEGANAGYTDGSSGRFNPSFPGTCPYVTAVGATQVPTGTDIVTSTQPETACETVIYSGGGFSNVFSMPSYQSDAVASYYSNHAPPYTSAQYNNSQQVRGYPDISANGANYVVAVDGEFSLVYGTSAASPVLGSILTLINEARYGNSQSSIGFINPVAYAHPEVFNDITSGGNQGCGTPGFEAVEGWDPVSGLGTPNYPKMKALFLGLP